MNRIRTWLSAGVLLVVAHGLAAQQTVPRILPAVNGVTLGQQTRSHYYLLIPDRESTWYGTFSVGHSGSYRRLGSEAGFIQTLAGDRRYAPAALDLALSARTTVRQTSDSTTRLEIVPETSLRLSSGPDRSPWAIRSRDLTATASVHSSVRWLDAQGDVPQLVVPRATLGASFRQPVAGALLMVEAAAEATQAFASEGDVNTAGLRAPWLLAQRQRFHGPHAPEPAAAGGVAEVGLRSRLTHLRWYSEWAIELAGFLQTASSAPTIQDLSGWHSAWGAGLTLRTRHVPVGLDLSVHAGVAVDIDTPTLRRGYVFLETRRIGD